MSRDDPPPRRFSLPAIDLFTPYRYTYPDSVEVGALIMFARTEREEFSAALHAEVQATDEAAATAARRDVGRHLHRLQELNVLIQRHGGEPVAHPWVRIL